MPTYSLGRRVEHDERSRRFAYRPRTAELRSVRHVRHAPVFDQGAVTWPDGRKGAGSCTGNATLGALATGPLYDALAAADLLPQFEEDTALRLYALATELDSFPGTFTYPPPGGDDSGSSGLAAAKAAKTNGWLAGYTHAFTPDDALLALTERPVIVGVEWHEDSFTPDPDGRCRLAGPVAGGHELVCDEIDVERQRVGFTNSWSEQWGLAGRGWWTFGDFRTLLARDGDCTILIPVTDPAPQPAPPPDADRQLVEALSSWAAARHNGANRQAAKAFTAWRATKGY